MIIRSRCSTFVSTLLILAIKCPMANAEVLSTVSVLGVTQLDAGKWTPYDHDLKSRSSSYLLLETMLTDQQYLLSR